MRQELKAMLVLVGVAVVSGVGFYVYTPQPATRSMAELRDAGITDPAGQKLVWESPERLTDQSIRIINRKQPGILRPSQRYARVARVAVCFLEDGGSSNCVRVADGGILALDLGASLTIPSLRQDLTGIDIDAGDMVDDAGESNSVDNALQYRRDDVRLYSCAQYDDFEAQTLRPNPWADAGSRFCGALNRLAVVPSPCVIPNCWTLSDGGWDDNAVVDCDGTGPFGLQDGGRRYRGCNVTPTQFSAGAACVPVECSVVAGDNPPDWL